MVGEVFLVAGARTPQGRYGAGVPVDMIDEVILGAADQAGEDNGDVARMAVLLAGLPDSVPGYAVNRLCASGVSMGEIAEEVALSEGITREESDAFALCGQERAIAAQDAGRFADEIVSVPTKNGTVTEDETPRRGTTLENLGQLKTVFKSDGIVTAGSASPFTDGAAALVVASASAGIAPNIMGLGPVPATHKALARAGWSVDDLGAVELNEAL